MSLLYKKCPRCKGKGRIPNWFLPGRHVCRRCDGAGEVLTLAGKAVQRMAGGGDEDEF